MDRGRGRAGGSGRHGGGQPRPAGGAVDRPHRLLRRNPLPAAFRGLESGLLDALEEPSDPELLVLEGGGHEEHLLGRGGVVVDLARGHAVPGGHHAARQRDVLLVELGPTPWKWR